MTDYGILIADTSWANHDSVEIDKTAQLRHQDRLVKGTKALIFVRAPIDAIVAEAEVIDDIIETETPPDSAFNPAIPANLRSERVIDRSETEVSPATPAPQEMANAYHVPLKLMRLKAQIPPIPLKRLRMILGSDFSAFDETWIPLSQAQYRQIVDVWR